LIPHLYTVVIRDIWSNIYTSVVQRSYVLGHNSLMPMEVRAPPHYYYFYYLILLFYYFLILILLLLLLLLLLIIIIIIIIK
jgi:hypothetical protein